MADFYYELNSSEKVQVQVEPSHDERHGYEVTIGERRYHVQAQMAQNGRLDLSIDGTRQQVYIHAEKSTGQKSLAVWLAGHIWTLVSTDKRQKRTRGANTQSNGMITAAMPGQVQAILVEEDSNVTAGDPLLILEAMKMEIRLTAPLDGTVTKIDCAVGDVVEGGQVLVTIE